MAVDIGGWLEPLGLAKYAELFAANEIDLAALQHLTEGDLKELGLPMGPRKKILAALAVLEPTDVARAGSPSASSEAEHRQLTVMFVDLVGSTALANRLDVEELRDLLARYQNVVSREVARHEGHIARFMGDGVLVYFGYPAARENDAERAVRSGLAIRDALSRERFSSGPLVVRIGVATGRVVVGDLVGEGTAQEQAVVGDTPNLAARLQAFAAPGAIVIASATRNLLRGLFDLEPLGPQRFKGFPEPLTCWRVVGERTVESRFEGTHGGRLSPFVGRDEELLLLEERWSRARDGEGQIVLLIGQAGIGKSRLMHALSERLAGTTHARLSYQCSPHHTISALHPIIAHLERGAGFVTEDSADAKRGKLESLLRRASNDVAEALPLIGSLLSLPAPEGGADLDLDARRRKQRTLEALLNQVAGLAARDPVLLIFEDAHWADPTSLELLEQLIDRVRDSRVLAIVSGRPEFKPAWVSHSNVTQMTLNRLRRRHSAQIVADLTGGKALPRAVVDEIVVRTDGIPLFAEELTKTVLESGLLEDAGDHLVLMADIASLAIPGTLHDSLMARLDRLGPVKEVAQVGAAIGREFSHRLLAAVSSLHEHDLARAIGELMHADLVFRRGSPPDATYVFKHALVRDTAYASLLRAKRRLIHQGIATALASQSRESSNISPELVAEHYTEAGLGEQAISYWQEAGRRAAERVADVEARAHLERALKLLKELPESRARDERELELLILLGPVLMNAEGSSSRAVHDTYVRARELCDRTGERARRFPVIWGLWSHLTHSGAIESAVDLVHEELFEIAESLGNEDFMLQAHHAAWSGKGWLADHSAVVAHANDALALYDVRRHRAHAFTYGGHDPGMCAAAESAIALWLLGFPNQAAERVDLGLQLARAVTHTFTTAHALAFVGHLHLMCREAARGLKTADELIAFCEQHGLSLWRANGLAVRGWALSHMGRASEGIADLRAAIRQRQAAGARARVPLHLAVLAHALAQAGETTEAHAAIEEAVSAMNKSGERTWETFVPWIKGEVYMSGPRPDPERAEACYLDACEVARRQGARSMELRATIGLAELRLQAGRKGDGRTLLAPIYEWFTEGFDTPDLKDAKALLDRLQ
jgi:class 3 adenylate cyclase/predicted ATPase